MRRGRSEGGSDDHGREVLALVASLKGEFRLSGQMPEWTHTRSDDRSGNEILTE